MTGVAAVSRRRTWATGGHRTGAERRQGGGGGERQNRDLSAWSERPPRRLADPPVSRQRVSYELRGATTPRLAARV
jgi:hypothetical protein